MSHAVVTSEPCGGDEWALRTDPTMSSGVWSSGTTKVPLEIHSAAVGGPAPRIAADAGSSSANQDVHTPTLGAAIRVLYRTIACDQHPHSNGSRKYRSELEQAPVLSKLGPYCQARNLANAVPVCFCGRPNYAETIGACKYVMGWHGESTGIKTQ